MNHKEQPMLYPNGSDLPLGHLIMHKPICTRHSMDPIPIIDCPASFPLTWCPCVLGGQSNPIEAPSILCCCLEHLLNGLYGKTICSKSGSQSLVPRCCIYATAFGLKWNCTYTATSPMLISSTLEVPFSYALQLYAHLQIKTLFHTPPLRPYSIGIRPHHIEPE